MGRPRGDAREKLIQGAFEALKTVGYSGASSRAIGRIAGVNPALVFYYFESVDDLLIAALAESNAERLSRYGGVVDESASISDLVATLGDIYRDDLASGHIAVVSELVAASISRPGLAQRVTELMEPWIELAERAVDTVLAESPLRELVSARAIAQIAVVFYLGANLLTRLQPSANEVAALLAEAERLSPMFDALAGSGPVDA